MTLQANVPRVLVVDDDPSMTALLEYVLEPQYVVDCVCDGESALEMLEAKQTYNAIVADYLLPGMNGLEFVRRARRRIAARGTGIVMMSAVGGAELGAQVESAGADAFLEKPIVLSQLLDELRRFAASRALAS